MGTIQRSSWRVEVSTPEYKGEDMTKFVRSDVIALNNIYEGYGKFTGFPNFSLAVARCSLAFNPVIKSIEAAERPTEEELALEEDKRKLIEKYAVRDTEGQPVTSEVRDLGRGQQLISVQLTDPQKYNKELQELIETKYSDVVSKSKVRIDALTALMLGEEEIAVVKFKLSDAPPDAINGNDLKLLLKYNLVVCDGNTE